MQPIFDRRSELRLSERNAKGKTQNLTGLLVKGLRKVEKVKMQKKCQPVLRPAHILFITNKTVSLHVEVDVL